MPAPKGNDYAVKNSGGGAPEGNQNAVGNKGGAPKGNINAMTHGRNTTPEDRRETFSEEEWNFHAALLHEHKEREPKYSEERAAELADAQVMETRLTVELLDILSEGGERFPTHTFDALLGYGRDLRETEDKAREEAWERRLDLLIGHDNAGSETNIDPNRLSTPEGPDIPTTVEADAPASPEKVMADRSEEPPEDAAPDGDGKQSEADADINSEREDGDGEGKENGVEFVTHHVTGAVGGLHPSY